MRSVSGLHRRYGDGFQTRSVLIILHASISHEPPTARPQASSAGMRQWSRGEPCFFYGWSYTFRSIHAQLFFMGCALSRSAIIMVFCRLMAGLFAAGIFPITTWVYASKSLSGPADIIYQSDRRRQVRAKFPARLACIDADCDMAGATSRLRRRDWEHSLYS